MRKIGPKAKKAFNVAALGDYELRKGSVSCGRVLGLCWITFFLHWV